MLIFQGFLGSQKHLFFQGLAKHFSNVSPVDSPMSHSGRGRVERPNKVKDPLPLSSIDSRLKNRGCYADS
jgi:hypothetical protein